MAPPSARSCPPEDVLLAYGRGELAPQRLANVNLHLVECSTCRQLAALAVTGPIDVESIAPGDTEPTGYMREEMLGAGLLGVVFRAQRLSDSRAIALRVVTSATLDEVPARSRVERARRLTRARGRGLVPYLDAGLFDEELFIVRELAWGRPLSVLAAQGSALLRDWRGAAILLRRVGVTLGRLHAQGMAHGGLTERDVWIDRSGSVEITDFGRLELIGGPLSGAAFTAATKGDRVEFCRLALRILEPLSAPRGLRRLFERAQDPTERGSRHHLDGLVAAIERELRPSRWVQGMTVASLTTIVFCTSSDTVATPATSGWCADDKAVWDDEERSRLLTSLRETDEPSAATMLSNLATRLDTYADQWSQARARVCSLDPSDAAAQRDQACLEAAQASFDALVSELETSPTNRVIRRALEGARALPTPAECRTSGPGDAVAEVLLALGQTHRAARLARAAAESSTARSDDHALATALTRLGRVLRHDDPRRAILVLNQAHDLANEVGNVDASRQTAIETLRLHTEFPTSVTERRRWLAEVDAFSASLDASDPMLAEAVEALGDAHASLGDSASARMHLRRAAQLRARSSGEDEIPAAAVRDRLARVLISLGEIEEAEELAARAWSSRMREYGPRHPEIAASHVTLAQLAMARSMPHAARHHRDAALEILEELEDIEPLAAARLRVALGETASVDR